MQAIMCRLLKDLIAWKGNFYMKCKWEKRVETVLVLLLMILGCIDYVQCSENKLNLIQTGNKSRASAGRTVFDHGIFRHDKPWDSTSPSPPKSDFSSSTKDAAYHLPCQNAHGCQTSDILSPPSQQVVDRDSRDRYTYDRFKRSVTTLNFHPKPRNASKIVGVKPLRIFKYITEDEVLVPQGSSERQHVTIFQPILNAATNKNKNKKYDQTFSNVLENDTSRQRVIAGTKINLKAKLNKKNDLQNNTTQISNINEANNSDNNATNNGSEFKSHQIKKVSSSSPKLENIMIFKPSLVIRKSNKTSLIPSGNLPSIKSNFNQQGGNSIIPSITAATAAVVAAQKDDESADPNSSTVNDRSLIQNKLYFDSVVMLNEEGQKQLLHQQHQTEEVHREKSSKSSSNSEKYADADLAGNGNDEIKNSEPSSSSSFSSKSNANSNVDTNVVAQSIASEKKISPSLSVTNNNETNANGKSTPTHSHNATSNNKKASDLLQKLNDKIDSAINGNNKDKAAAKVLKSKKGKNGKKAIITQKGLDEDDNEQDGSERSRRSPFKVPMKFQQHPRNKSNKNLRYDQQTQFQNTGGNQHLTRSALFRRNPGATRIRSTLIARKFIPRTLSNPATRLINPGKIPVGRTFLPMKPMPMTPIAKQSVPNLALVPGPVGPGPVGPPIAAIKVANFNNHKNHKNLNTNNLMAPSMLSGKDLMADSSRAVYSYKPISTNTLLNQAASSYYSPTYKRFKNRFHNQIADIMESQRELEDSIHRWEETRNPSRQAKHPSRNSGKNHRDRSRYHHERDRSDRYERDRGRERPPHSNHRSGQHSHHPHHRHSPRGKKFGPKYTYPKNAENIQDILKYFDKDEDPRGSPMSNSFDKEGAANPRRQQSVLPSVDRSNSLPGRPHPKLADLSGEFRDVHASLLKDIREFAKRPNLLDSSDKSSSDRSHARPFDSNENISPFDPIDELFNEKPKPVRDLIKPDLYSLENIRERIALKRGKLHGKFRDKDRDVNSHHDEHHHDGHHHDEHHHDGHHHDEHHHDEHHHDGHKHDEHHHNERHDDGYHHDGHQPHADVADDGFYDSQRPSRQNSAGVHSIEHVKNSLFSSKEEYDSPSTFNKRDKHKEVDDPHTIFPSSHFLREKDSIKENSNPFEYSSAEFTKPIPKPSPTKPIVLKRPNEPFRIQESEPKKKPEHDYFWNTFSNGFEKAPSVNYESPLVIKSPTPSVLQPFNPYNAFGHPTNAAPHSLPKPVSMEDEDIVEIHTGGPGPSVQSYSSPPDQNQFKQDRLKKMYMDVLQQKMHLEAALMSPPHALPSYQPPAYHPQSISSMHTSSSVHPQHNPLNSQHNHQLAQHNPLHSQHNHLYPQHNSFHLQHNPLHPQHSPLQITRMGQVPQINAFSQAPAPSLPQFQGMTGYTRRKKPMRMKIHIYPNGNDGLEQGIEAANLLAAGGFGTSGFSASNPPGVVAPPPKDSGLGKPTESAMPSGPTRPLPTSPSGYGGTSSSGPMGPTPAKNKNVVLHLHVHRRNDMLGPLELETEGSAPVPATAKPLTYKEIFDEQMKKSEQQRNSNLSNHRQAEEDEEPSQSTQDTQEREPNEDSERGERDKSASMEVPIHDEKIEDVFHSIMKSRKKPDDRKKRS